MGRGTSAKYIFERHLIYTLILWESKKKGSERQRFIVFIEFVGLLKVFGPINQKEATF